MKHGWMRLGGLILGPMALASGLAWSGQPAQLATGEFIPYVSASLRAKGISSEIVTEAFRRMGRPAALTFLPWRRAYEESKRGDFEGSFPWARNAERELDFLYSDPLIVDHIAIFVARDSPVKHQADLTGRVACIPAGWDLVQSQALITQASLRLERPPDLPNCMLMLRAGRVDLVPVNEMAGWDTARLALGRADVVRTLPEVVGTDTTYLIAPRSRPESVALIAAFNKALQSMHADGSYQRILASWMP
ncbi:substrate-binding periplasmic protein [Andreprevotia chitinilytica]|uniref:substrate-binding periplasmic protein n=1 Tax=Andreprevotia chitinilytica TaxID=396808 RepID=UPI00146FF82B|nr:transporter substrate-binding domain-containing protein [Andreprevotia chitinilytica]